MTSKWNPKVTNPKNSREVATLDEFLELLPKFFALDLEKVKKQDSKAWNFIESMRDGQEYQWDTITQSQLNYAGVLAKELLEPEDRPTPRPKPEPIPEPSVPDLQEEILRELRYISTLLTTMKNLR